MHKFMRTVGFSMYQKKRDMEALLKDLAGQAARTGRLAEKEGSMFCELRAELADGMGVVMAGEMDEEGNFSQEYYFPYVKNTGISSGAEAKAIARHEVLCTLDDILRESAKLLVPGGRFYMVHRPFRLAEIRSEEHTV